MSIHFWWFLVVAISICGSIAAALVRSPFDEDPS